MKKQRKPKGGSQQSTQTDRLLYVEYKVTSEPIRDLKYNQLPPEVHEAVERLHELTLAKPKQAIPELVEWIQRYPQVVQFYNYLSMAYMAVGDRKNGEQTILQNYQQNPDYLFARLNYAQICLDKGKYDKAAEALDHKFDLKLLYPKRKKFHITEYTGFMGVVGLYYAATGEREAAENAYTMLKQIAPQDRMTKQLGRTLHPSWLVWFLRRLAGESR